MALTEAEKALAFENCFDVLPDKRQSDLFLATARIYGDDVETILNALQEMTARIALMSGVEPEAFAGGMKHHWDYLANHINEAVLHQAADQ
jgi:hypothetical protein